MPLHTDEPKAKVCLGRSSAAERIEGRYHGTGAANHMTGHVDDFAEIDRTVTCIVKFCNSSILEIKGIDTIIFVAENREHDALIIVYYIPCLKNSIIRSARQE
jgi:hypothetical protein